MADYCHRRKRSLPSRANCQRRVRGGAKLGHFPRESRGRYRQRIELAGLRAVSASVSFARNRLVFVSYLGDFDIWRYHLGGGMEPLIVSSLYDGEPQVFS